LAVIIVYKILAKDMAEDIPHNK